MSERIGISVARPTGPIHLSGPRESKNQKFIYLFPAFARILNIISAFMAFDALQSLHVIQLLFCVNLIASCIHFALQQPFAHGKSLSVNLATRIATHAVFDSLSYMLFLYAIPLCGAVRSILIFYVEDIVIATALGAIFSSSNSGEKSQQTGASSSGGNGTEGTTARKRGVFCLILAIVVLLFFDNESHFLDSNTLQQHMQHHQGLHQLLHMATISVGLPDHRGGIGVLLIAVILKFVTRTTQRKLTLDVGGPKRLQALTTICSTFMLLPIAIVITLFRATPTVHVPFLYTIAAIIAFALPSVADFYCSQFALQKMDASSCARLLSWITLWSTMLVGWLWVSPVLVLPLQDRHVFSGGIIIAFLFLLYASWLLTSPQKVRSGHFMGYDAQGVPHWRAESMMGGISQLNEGMPGLALAGRRALRQIIDDTESRRIFYYLCLNLGFTGVEFVYGIYTNSLGLLSDSFHMLFDSSALVVGLYASVISKSKNTRMYPYGFARFELLSGYINGLFLCVIAFYIVTEAISRFITPPEVKTEKLLLVSFLGLCINLVGLFVFGHHHHHGGGGGGCEHSHDHGHSHGHDHGGGGHVHSEANRLGLYLHVLADTLGSVGVIVSSLLIQYFGWTRADPICSFAIASLIVASVIPLLKESGSTLVLRTPEMLESEITQALDRVLVQVQNVLGFRNVHFWRQSDDTLIGSLVVVVKSDADEQLVAAEIMAMLKATTGIKVGNLCLQVEKEEFVQRMSGLRRDYMPLPMKTSAAQLSATTRDSNAVAAAKKHAGNDLMWVSSSAPSTTSGMNPMQQYGNLMQSSMHVGAHEKQAFY